MPFVTRWSISYIRTRHWRLSLSRQLLFQGLVATRICLKWLLCHDHSCEGWYGGVRRCFEPGEPGGACGTKLPRIPLRTCCKKDPVGSDVLDYGQQSTRQFEGRFAVHVSCNPQISMLMFLWYQAVFYTKLYFAIKSFWLQPARNKAQVTVFGGHLQSIGLWNWNAIVDMSAFSTAASLWYVCFNQPDGRHYCWTTGHRLSISFCVQACRMPVWLSQWRGHWLLSQYFLHWHYMPTLQADHDGKAPYLEQCSTPHQRIWQTMSLPVE